MHSNNNIHIISIGGSVMHDLAINLKKNGNVVTGSDDKIYEPSKSNLKKNNLYPKKIGYYKENIAKKLDFVITGMHTKSNNIELQTAKKKRIPIYSYPEFIRKSSDNKHRIVIAGSHGKTTVTSIIMHVLKMNKINFDYVIGGRADGFTSNIKISENPLIIIEGDEYLTSPLDKNPKFLKYDHHIVLLNGIEWDHCNVFPNKKVYVKQFKSLINKTPKGGEIIYYDGDNNVEKVINDYKNQKYVKEVLVVDNHSTDKTIEIAKLCSAKIIAKDENKGFAHSCIVGMRESLKTDANIIIFTECDGTFSGNDLEKMVPYLDNCDMVIGTRQVQVLSEKGNTLIKINVSDNENNLYFQLKNKRNIERKTLNLLRNKEISAIIG